MPTKIQTILDLHYDNPNKTRFDCPFCFRSNSLSISEYEGNIRYHCFGNSCRTKGYYHQRLSIEQIKINHTVDLYGNRANAASSNFIVPNHFVSVGDRPNCREYLIRNNCMGAWASERIHLRYDPRQDRIVFLVYDHFGKIINATGRILRKNADAPKWHIYGSNSSPFVAGNKDTAIIVEDCASASSISHLVTGIALLGTNFKDINYSILRKYKHVIIGLDKDALRKAVELEASIRYFASTSILLLDDDLKALDSGHLFEFLGKRINLNDIGDL